MKKVRFKDEIINGRQYCEISIFIPEDYYNHGTLSHKEIFLKHPFLTILVNLPADIELQVQNADFPKGFGAPSNFFYQVIYPTTIGAEYLGLPCFLLKRSFEVIEEKEEKRKDEIKGEE